MNERIKFLIVEEFTDRPDELLEACPTLEKAEIRLHYYLEHGHNAFLEYPEGY